MYVCVSGLTPLRVLFLHGLIRVRVVHLLLRLCVLLQLQKFCLFQCLLCLPFLFAF